MIDSIEIFVVLDCEGNVTVSTGRDDAIENHSNEYNLAGATRVISVLMKAARPVDKRVDITVTGNDEPVELTAAE